MTSAGTLTQLSHPEDGGSMFLRNIETYIIRQYHNLCIYLACVIRTLILSRTQPGEKPTRPTPSCFVRSTTANESSAVSFYINLHFFFSLTILPFDSAYNLRYRR